jgi:hypothetical protein
VRAAAPQRAPTVGSLLLGSMIVLLAGSGCAGNKQVDIPPDSPFASRSLSNYDAALRHYVVAGDTAALDRIEQAGPGDELVRLLNRGLYLHRLGRYEESNTALQEAEALAEERYRKSIAQTVASFMVSDLVLDYTPPAHERAMIHYYGMLNYMALGDLEEALVEARRANQYLYRYSQDNDGHRSYSNDALVEYLAGLLHWSGGDDNDALVSLRQADGAFDNYLARYGIVAPNGFGRDLAQFARRVGVPEVVDEAIAKYDLQPGDATPDRSLGELIVIVENGFVAHRAEEKIYIPILRREKRAIASGSVDSILGATASILVRTVVFMNQASREARSYLREYEGVVILGSMALDADLLSFAWPSYRLDAHAVTGVTVEVGGTRASATVVDDLSAIAARDFEEEKPKILARMVARGLFKEITASKAEAWATDKAGVVVGFLTRIGARTAATLTERADRRSWSLLPAELHVARLSLEPGSHSIMLRVRDSYGRERVIDMGDVTIRSGRLSVATAFVTGDYRGDVARFERATQQVDYHAPPIRENR